VRRTSSADTLSGTVTAGQVRRTSSADTLKRNCHRRRWTRECTVDWRAADFSVTAEVVRFDMEGQREAKNYPCVGVWMCGCMGFMGV
jgi:hypothetical protein